MTSRPPTTSSSSTGEAAGCAALSSRGPAGAPPPGLVGRPGALAAGPAGVLPVGLCGALAAQAEAAGLGSPGPGPRGPGVCSFPTKQGPREPSSRALHEPESCSPHGAWCHLQLVLRSERWEAQPSARLCSQVPCVPGGAHVRPGPPRATGRRGENGCSPQKGNFAQVLGFQKLSPAPDQAAPAGRQPHPSPLPGLGLGRGGRGRRLGLWPHSVPRSLCSPDARCRMCMWGPGDGLRPAGACVRLCPHSSAHLRLVPTRGHLPSHPSQLY